MIISEHCLNQIKYTCWRISKVEWSGICLFKEVTGSIEKPEEFVIELVEIWPMSKDSQAYTEFNYDGEVLQFLMANPERMSLERGIIHSHHNMKTFFSGTDNSEMEENARHHNYYLSVIVNNAGDITAKIAVHSIEEQVINGVRKWMDSSGNRQQPYTYTQSREVVDMYECNIVQPEVQIDDEVFSNRVNHIIAVADEQAKQAAIAKAKALQSTPQLTFFNDVKPRVSVVDFVPKFIAQDIAYRGFTFDAMKALEAEVESSVMSHDGLVEGYANAFDEMYDMYFDEDAQVQYLDVVDKILQLAATYRDSFTKAYKVIEDVYAELTLGIEGNDPYDLLNPMNTDFYGGK